ncbi:hypothetical protein GCM10023094_21000 [Rhodococcus olei]|uniref:Uncharacterized protein n=1 Tax=Rhodococcus olei TaxID=2161675 RepID=A0ABP8P1P7_9NOCA
MRAGPSPAWQANRITPTYRPDPATLLVPMLMLVAALASPLLLPLPVAGVTVAAALGLVVLRARAGGPRRT